MGSKPERPPCADMRLLHYSDPLPDARAAGRTGVAGRSPALPLKEIECLPAAELGV